MISEKKFATAYTSFWQQNLPMADAFIRRVNLDYERYLTPLKSYIRPQRRALVNEIAFRLFIDTLTNTEVKHNKYESILDKICHEATQYIARLRGSTDMNFEEPSAHEKGEAVTIADRLGYFFSERPPMGSILGSPAFPGCGIVQQCRADILAGTTLFEVKAGERDFRLVDFRQLIVYCALNYSAARYQIENVGVINPRVGVFFIIDVEYLVRSTAGISPVELFTEIIRFLTSERISR